MISFIIPVFRDVRFLDRAINSINQQTRQFGNINVVVVNDSDDDTTLQQINDIINKYHKVLWITTIETKDIGSSRARNTGADFGGEYLIFLDPDDYIHPDFLEELYPILYDNPDYAFAYSNTLYTDGKNFQSVPSPDYSFFQLMVANYIPYCSLIRANSFYKAGGFDPTNFNYWEDYQLWINMGSKGLYGKHVPKDLFFYTVRADSSSLSLRARQLPELYKSYIVYRNPYIFPLEWQQKAREIVTSYPEGFMSWKPFEQENYLKERNKQ